MLLGVSDDLVELLAELDAAGLVAVHLRRGPWGMLQPTPTGAVVVTSLAALPDVLLPLAR